MATYNLNYRNDTNFEIVLDFQNKDISIQRTKAGNDRIWAITDFGSDIKEDKIVVKYEQIELDSEGDLIFDLFPGRISVTDKDLFSDMIAYTNAGGIVNQAKISVDVLLKTKLTNTRVFNIDGDFIQPIYHNLSGVSPTLDSSGLSNDDGYITTVIDVSAGYGNMEVRYTQDEINWSGWTPIINDSSIGNLDFGTYYSQVRTLDASLMIEAIENITI